MRAIPERGAGHLNPGGQAGDCSPREVQEERNAIAAYDRFEQWNPGAASDLLETHHVLMAGLLDDAGRYRRGSVGVMADREIMHLAPPVDRVPFLMADLFQWLAASTEHPLITSSVFHHEFEFIHPFADGNGRMGRLWQSLILARWKPLFADIPVDSLVHEHQTEYYRALHMSTEQTDSAPFIEFMLRMILNAASLSAPQVTLQVTLQVRRVLEIIQDEMTREAMQSALDLRDRKSFRERYLLPAPVEGLIEMTIPDRPNSRLQKYRLTGKGQKMAAQGKVPS